MQKLHLIIYALVLTLVVGCTVNEKPGRVRHSSDSLYTDVKALAIYDYQPLEALQILDSACALGHVSDVWAEIYRTRIYGWTCMGELVDSLLHGPEGVRFDSARVIGERLLLHDSVRNNLEMQQDILEILVYTARQQEDTALWLCRSRQLVDVCHQQGAETEALRTEAEVGAVLCSMGRSEEGMVRLDSVITLLDNPENRHFNELDALLIALKRKIVTLSREGRNAETIPLARRIVERLDDYELHPDVYHDGTYREPEDSIQRADYIQFYRMQAQSTITAAYAAIGEHGNMAETYNQIERSVREAAAREHIARYHALKQQMRRKEAESHSRLMTAVAIASAVALLLILLFASFIVYQNRMIRKKNRSLVRLIEEKASENAMNGNEGSLTRERTEEETALFQTIDTTIRTEGLYADSTIQRQAVCERFNIRREVLNQLLSDFADGQSFPAYINSIRLTEACRQLKDEPSKTVNAIAEEVGLLPRNLRRLFVERYGITPTEYRQGLQDSVQSAGDCSKDKVVE